MMEAGGFGGTGAVAGSLSGSGAFKALFDIVDAWLGNDGLHCCDSCGGKGSCGLPGVFSMLGVMFCGARVEGR